MGRRQIGPGFAARCRAMTSLYIYYKVRPDLALPLREAVHTLQARLRSAMPGLAATLWSRSDAQTGDGERATWMEVYQFNGHADARAWTALDEALSTLVAQLPEGIDGPRHSERFSLMPPSISTGYGGLPCA